MIICLGAIESKMIGKKRKQSFIILATERKRQRESKTEEAGKLAHNICL